MVMKFEDSYERKFWGKAYLLGRRKNMGNKDSAGLADTAVEEMNKRTDWLTEEESGEED